MTDKEEILGAIQSLRGELQTEILGAIQSLRGELQTEMSALSDRLTHVETKVDKLDRDVGEVKKDIQLQSDRFSYYQQATQSLVNLASSLITGASIAIIAGVVLILLRSK